MSRFVMLLLCASVLMAGLSADETAPPKFGKSYPSDAIRYVTATSEDKQVTTLVFENFVLSTDSGRGEVVEAKTRSLTFGNVIDAKADAIVTLDLRGYVSTVAGGSAALVVMSGGETTLVDLQKAIESNAAKEKEVSSRKSAAEKAEAAGLAVTARPKNSELFFARVPVQVPKGQSLQVTCVLIVDRQQGADSHSMITIDSIDMALKAAPTKGEKSEAKKSTRSSRKTAAATSTESIDSPVATTKAEPGTAEKSNRKSARASSKPAADKEKSAADGAEKSAG